MSKLISGGMRKDEVQKSHLKRTEDRLWQRAQPSSQISLLLEGEGVRHVFGVSLTAVQPSFH